MYRKQGWDGAPRLNRVPTDSVETNVVMDDQAIPATTEAPGLSPDPAESHRDAAAPAMPADERRGASATAALALGAVLVLAVGAAGWFGYGWWTIGRFTVATDDAYVQAYNTTLAAKVSGYVANVAVTDNTRVRAGDVIATIDDGDYRLAVDSAREKVATQQATIARMGHQIAAQEAAVAQAKTQLVSAQARPRARNWNSTARTNWSRADASSRQLLEQAQANRDQAVAAVQGAQAAIEFGRRQCRCA